MSGPPHVHPLPGRSVLWYRHNMRGNVAFESHALTIGDRGRLVIPAPIRDRHDWAPGSALIALDMDDAVVLMSPDGALALLRSKGGSGSLDAFIQQRRQAAQRELQEWDQWRSSSTPRR